MTDLSIEQASALVQQGQVLIAAGKDREAYDCLLRAEPAKENDPWFTLIFGYATSRAVSAAAAIPIYRRALSFPESAPAARERLGRALLDTGDIDGAQHVFQQAVAERPADMLSLSGLGMALTRLGRDEQGLDHVRRAFAGKPTHGVVAGDYVTAHIMTGHAEAAIAVMQSVMQDLSQKTELPICLGRLLLATDKLEEARAQFEIGVTFFPDAVQAWLLLADVKKKLGDPSALAALERAVELDPTNRRARNRLASHLLRTGQRDAAMIHYHRNLPWVTKRLHLPTRAGECRVAITNVPGSGNTPTRYLIDAVANRTDSINVFPGGDYPADWFQTEYDLIFNAMGDADVGNDNLRLLAELAPTLRLPILNRPEAVLRTTRDQIALRLADLPHATTPATKRIHVEPPVLGTTEAIADSVGYPLLLRPIGTHGGKDVALVEDWDALRDALIEQGGGEYYLTRFHDFASPDGVYRKYRVVFVAGEMLPYHLSISAGWLNHYFRGLMDGPEAYRVEEAAFLDDPGARLGPKVIAALTEIGRRIDLDYFGVDFALNADDGLLLFECNSTMLIDIPQKTMFRYRIPHAVRIRDAMTAMIRARAGSDNSSRNQLSVQTG